MTRKDIVSQQQKNARNVMQLKIEIFQIFSNYFQFHQHSNGCVLIISITHTWRAWK